MSMPSDENEPPPLPPAPPDTARIAPVDNNPNVAFLGQLYGDFEGNGLVRQVHSEAAGYGSPSIVNNTLRTPNAPGSDGDTTEEDETDENGYPIGSANLRGGLVPGPIAPDARPSLHSSRSNAANGLASVQQNGTVGQASNAPGLISSSTSALNLPDSSNQIETTPSDPNQNGHAGRSTNLPIPFTQNQPGSTTLSPSTLGTVPAGRSSVSVLNRTYSSSRVPIQRAALDTTPSQRNRALPVFSHPDLPPYPRTRLEMDNWMISVETGLADRLSQARAVNDNPIEDPRFVLENRRWIDFHSYQDSGRRQNLDRRIRFWSNEWLRIVVELFDYFDIRLSPEPEL